MAPEYPVPEEIGVYTVVPAVVPPKVKKPLECPEEGKCNYPQCGCK